MVLSSLVLSQKNDDEPVRLEGFVLLASTSAFRAFSSLSGKIGINVIQGGLPIWARAMHVRALVCYAPHFVVFQVCVSACV